jgi:hypothetical protein
MPDAVLSLSPARRSPWRLPGIVSCSRIVRLAEQETCFLGDNSIKVVGRGLLFARILGGIHFRWNILILVSDGIAMVNLTDAAE